MTLEIQASRRSKIPDLLTFAIPVDNYPFQTAKVIGIRRTKDFFFLKRSKSHALTIGDISVFLFSYATTLYWYKPLFPEFYIYSILTSFFTNLWFYSIL